MYKKHLTNVLTVSLFKNSYAANPFKLVKFDISPTSASNLPDGNILIWIGATKGTTGQDENAITTNYQIINTEGKDINGGFAKQMHLGEMFCTGTSNLPNGDILINGGSNAESTIIFSYKKQSFSKTKSMSRPRGYNANSVTTNNRIFTLGGEWGPSGYSSNDYYGEIMTLNANGSNIWKSLKNVSGSLAGKVDDPNGDQSNQNHLWIFPFKDSNNVNRVFKAGPSPNMHVINLDAGTMKYVGKRGSDTMGIQGTAVQFAPGKILTLGGANYQDNPSDTEYMLASNISFVIDINYMVTNQNAVPVVKGPFLRSARRVCHNAVVLPGGKVLVIGGQTNLKKWSDDYAALRPELYDPKTNKFTLLNSELKYARNYHSVALLLKDGRVLIAGGGSDIQGSGCDKTTKGCPTHFDGEIYTPPYLVGISDSKRPKILSVVNTVNTGKCIINELDLTRKNCSTLVITIATNSCGSNGITGCTFELIRLSSVTHSINNDQLRIPLIVNIKKNYNTATFSIPATSVPFTISGYYHLFAINNSSSIPSIATVIRVNRN
jgi:hypothetical protein